MKFAVDFGRIVDEVCLPSSADVQVVGSLFKLAFGKPRPHGV